MRPSIVLRELLSRPTSVLGVAPGSRWLKSPSAMAAAVASTSRSGAKVDVTSSLVRAAPSTTIDSPNPRKIPMKRAMVWLVSSRLIPTTTVRSLPVGMIWAGAAIIRHSLVRSVSDAVNAAPSMFLTVVSVQ